MGKEEMKETCKFYLFIIQGCPRKAWKSSSLQLPKPTSRAVEPQELLSSPSPLNSKEHRPHFMAGSTCQPDLGEQGCSMLSAKAQGVDNRTGGGHASFCTSGAFS